MNAAVSMIVVLDCSEIDTEVLDVGIEAAEFNDYREVSRDDGDVNSVLAVIRERVRFFCKDRQKFINLFIQSISELYWVSQLYPRTKEQEELSKVT